MATLIIGEKMQLKFKKNYFAILTIENMNLVVALIVQVAYWLKIKTNFMAI